jgi:glycosyltransferase involved in cell wall biosynthesis
VINGRFLCQPLTGVQRYAREVVKAIDTLLEEDRDLAAKWSIELHHPPGQARPDQYRHIQTRQVGKRNGHLWEQLDLLSSARGTLLLNLGNSGPVLHPAMIGTIHDMGVFAHGEAYSFAYRTGYRILLRILARRARKLLTVSEFSAGEIIRYCGIDRDRIVVAQNAANHLGSVGLDPALLERLDLKPHSFVLAVGSRNRLKNIPAVVDAIGRLGAERPRLVVVGERRSAIFQNAPVVDAAYLTYTGPVSDAALRSLYRNALCLVFPSIYEGFGIPPLEAMQEGCPVVAAQTSALPEVCGNAVLYCDPGNPDDIADKIVALREDGVLCRLAQAGKERSALFSWRNTAITILDHLREIRQP